MACLPSGLFISIGLLRTNLKTCPYGHPENGSAKEIKGDKER
jgi:hypothetical protein